MAESRPPMCGWVRLLLIASLAANLAVAGIAVGLWARFGGEAGPSAGSGAVFYREMPPELRREMRSDLRRTMRQQGRSRAGLTHEIVTVIRADPLDADRLDTLLAAQSRAMETGAEAIRAAWLAQVSRMTAAQRAAYADRVEAALSRPRKRGERGD